MNSFISKLNNYLNSGYNTKIFCILSQLGLFGSYLLSAWLLSTIFIEFDHIYKNSYSSQLSSFGLLFTFTILEIFVGYIINYQYIELSKMNYVLHRLGSGYTFARTIINGCTIFLCSFIIMIICDAFDVPILKNALIYLFLFAFTLFVCVVFKYANSVTLHTKYDLFKMHLIKILVALVTPITIIAIAITHLRSIDNDIVGFIVPVLLFSIFYAQAILVNKYYEYNENLTKLDFTDTENDFETYKSVHSIVLVSKINKPEINAIKYASGAINSENSYLEMLTVGGEERKFPKVKEFWKNYNVNIPFKVIVRGKKSLSNDIAEYIIMQKHANPTELIVVYVPIMQSNGMLQFIFHKRLTDHIKKQIGNIEGIIIVDVSWGVKK
ncbi:MAG: hypothetical protein LBN03_00190 [Bifidobacteriaceae bacterium]|jgi:hypothetical protein|nr:hypothetical protein [Bifidobacteriaceae bacterium]